MNTYKTTLLLASLLASSYVYAGSSKPGKATLTNDFTSGKPVIAKIISVTRTSMMARSLNTGYEGKFARKLKLAMVGKCISVKKIGQKHYEVKPTSCPMRNDAVAKLDLKQNPASSDSVDKPDLNPVRHDSVAKLEFKRKLDAAFKNINYDG